MSDEAYAAALDNARLWICMSCSARSLLIGDKTQITVCPQCGAQYPIAPGSRVPEKKRAAVGL